MYDLVFVTHLPSFYKVNLYNELAKNKKIYVIFVGKTSDIRSQDFTGAKPIFSYEFLDQSSFENRNRLTSCFRLFRFIFNHSFERMVLGGWDLPEFWLAAFVGRKNKNALALESTVYGSRSSGLTGYVKRFFLSRISKVYASGRLQKSLLEQLKYLGEVVVTRGVGLADFNRHQKLEPGKYEKRFLYVGRLSPEKNLSWLLDVFSGLPEHHLTIVGNGPEEGALKQNAPKNVRFIDYKKNADLHSVFLECDFLILPSLREPWGLVIDESFYFGKPVILSEVCGACELVDEACGIIFRSGSKENLKEVILSITSEKYEILQSGARKIDMVSKDQAQVRSYF